MNEATTSGNMVSTSYSATSTAQQRGREANGTDRSIFFSKELSRLQQFEQIHDEVAKRLLNLHQRRELSRLVTARAQEIQLEEAMTALETFIRNNEV